MSTISWKSIITKLVHSEHLEAEESRWFVDDLMNGSADPACVGAVLALQQQLGLTAQEIRGAAQAMVSHAIALPIDGEITDIVGTGGDGASTVNLSTMGAVVAASSGIKIVKHGNRAASSKCGAADVLEALGYPLNLSPEQAATVAKECGITFAFAKTFHPAMRFVAPIRSALTIPTVFNVLGPLTNPAKPQHVAIGCARREVSPLMADVYASNGQTGMVFTSEDGLDEMTLTGEMSVWEINDGQVTFTKFDPCRALDLSPVAVADLAGGLPDVNASMFNKFLDNEPIAARSTALLNAAAAIVADGSMVGTGSLAERFGRAYALAEQQIVSGHARQTFDHWVEVAQSCVE